METLTSKTGMAFSKWYDSVHGEPSYQEAFEAGIAWQAAQAAQPAQMPGWLPIESAPKDGTEVLLGGKCGSVTCAIYSQREQRWYGDTDCPCEWATHWMPLPAAPSTKEKAE